MKGYEGFTGSYKRRLEHLEIDIWFIRRDIERLGEYHELNSNKLERHSATIGKLTEYVNDLNYEMAKKKGN